MRKANSELNDRVAQSKCEVPADLNNPEVDSQVKLIFDEGRTAPGALLYAPSMLRACK